ncbi:FK506 binding protein proline rotamase rapamycin-binding protein [Rhizoclosmatium hyalinum]|nr:FK506 binding protein proline rotamase rapamycin-binding protein [Rhizoclosmatium hyalinum]
MAVQIADGITKTIITPGDGVTFPVAGTSTVTVLYTGTFMDGTIFDASSSPFSVVIGAGKVIPCWDLGVPKMSVGEVAKLWCSWQQAYGENGDGQKIPAKSDLNFQVTLISIS